MTHERRGKNIVSFLLRGVAGSCIGFSHVRDIYDIVEEVAIVEKVVKQLPDARKYRVVMKHNQIEIL
jgi:hypothetical protein